MLNNYIALFVAGIIIAVIMYVYHLKDTNKELKIQKQNLQVKVIQEKTKANIKEFEARQKAKKEQIIKDTSQSISNQRGNNEKDINLSVGPHIMDF